MLCVLLCVGCLCRGWVSGGWLLPVVCCVLRCVVCFLFAGWCWLSCDLWLVFGHYVCRRLMLFVVLHGLLLAIWCVMVLFVDCCALCIGCWLFVAGCGMLIACCCSVSVACCVLLCGVSCWWSLCVVCCLLFWCELFVMRCLLSAVSSVVLFVVC